MSWDEHPPMHEYVGRFDGEVGGGGDFFIVSAASLEGSEVQVSAGSQKGPVYTLTDVAHSGSWQSSDPPAKRYRAILEAVRPRNEENVPHGIPVTTWLRGVSTEPLPDFDTKLTFLVSPQKHWSSVELWVHASTTSGDAKHYLEQQCLAHDQAELFGTVSKQKIGWNKKLLEGSHENWAPVEDRVLIPSNSRLDLLVGHFVCPKLCFSSCLRHGWNIHVAKFCVLACSPALVRVVAVKLQHEE